MKETCKRRRSGWLTDIWQTPVLLALGVIGYGAMIYPPLTLLVAAANVGFILCLLVACIADRIRYRLARRLAKRT